jgi:hypothetical protein
MTVHNELFSVGKYGYKCRSVKQMVGYPSGQRGQTVNLLAYAFAGSNPAPTTTSRSAPVTYLEQL